MFDKTFLLLLLLPYLICTQPIELTDNSWREMLNGQWMVEFYAPWCSACQQFKQVWSDFSDAMSSKNIKIAAVNIEKYPSLSARFGIKLLPTVFHVNDGVFRQYDNERSLRALKNYILKDEWQKQETMPSSFAPDSLSMTLMSIMFDLSGFLKNTYSILLEQYGWPSWLIYIVCGLAIISIGIFIGFTSLMITDYAIAIWYKIRPMLFGKATETLEKPKQQTIDDNESAQSDESDKVSDDEESNSDVTDTQNVTTDQTVRQRRFKD